MKAPLWMYSDDSVTIRLAICRNCGKVKVSSRPCSFNHLAAVLEFRAQFSPTG